MLYLLVFVTIWHSQLWTALEWVWILICTWRYWWIYSQITLQVFDHFHQTYWLISNDASVTTFYRNPFLVSLLFRDLSAFGGGGPRVVVSTAAFHARVRGSVPGLGGLKETKLFLPHPRVKVSFVGGLRDREVACSASDRQGSNFESCVWRTVSSQSSHHPQEVLLA